MSFRTSLVLVATALGTAACLGPATSPASNIAERQVTPHQANAGIVNWTNRHLIWLDPHVTASQLVLLLPGAGGVPEDARAIGPIAAEAGYRVIALMYPDDVAVVATCSTDPDPTCMESMRREIVEGVDASTHAIIDSINSIDGRLADLLRHLDRTYPDEHWNEFLEGNTPRWSAIVVAGVSQGSGHAAYIGTRRSVARVVMFGGPPDGYNGLPAPWMHVGATPAERYFGFHHVVDQLASIEPNWRALGLMAFGPVVTVDSSTTAFGGAHMFVTEMLPSTRTYNDGPSSVFLDLTTPLTPSGTPVYAKIWRYLLGAP